MLHANMKMLNFAPNGQPYICTSKNLYVYNIIRFQYIFLVSVRMIFIPLFKQKMGHQLLLLLSLFYQVGRELMSELSNLESPLQFLALDQIYLKRRYFRGKKISRISWFLL